MSVLLNVYSTLTHPPRPDFPHQLRSTRNLTDPKLAEHLHGFIGYVMNQGDGQMTPKRYDVYRHIQRVRHQWAMEIDVDDWDAYARWATQANAICFVPDGTVRDPAGLVLVAPGKPGDNEPDADSQTPFPADARQRKAATEARLKKHNIPFNRALPPVISESEVELRTPAAVAQRMLALALVAVLAESIASKDRLPLSLLQEKSPLAFQGLTPAELAFVHAKSPKDQEVVNFAWRYESLATLQWALGLIELPSPSKICNVPQVAKIALDNTSPRFLQSAKLRPTPAILDALDLHQRLHWATTQARLDQTNPPANLEPGVILERCHALNWLVQFEGSDWDEVTVAS